MKYIIVKVEQKLKIVKNISNVKSELRSALYHLRLAKDILDAYELYMSDLIKNGYQEENLDGLTLDELAYLWYEI